VFRAHVGVPAGFEYFNGTTSVQTNTWYHVAMTYDGGYLKLYVNGNQDGSLAVSGPILVANNPFRIGSGGPGPWNFSGRVDELSLYDRALSVAEIQEIYNAGDSGKCPVGVTPTITQQPAGGTTFAGGNVTLTVAAKGDGPLSYQWRFNGANLEGQTSTALSLNNVRSADAGSYSVVVTNRAGSALSAEALLKGNMRVPTISARGFLVSFTGVPGHTYTLQRAASLAGPWVTLTTVTLGLTGEGSFEDTQLLPGAAFYRTVSQ
jgi:nitrogen fixation protein FixH